MTNVVKNLTVKSSLADLFLEIPEKAEALQTVKIPLLVIACCAYRLSENRSEKYSILDNLVLKGVNESDYILADKIKDYYSKKLAWLKLKGNKLTKFREELGNLLYDDFSTQLGEYTYPSKYMGMAYRLPYFYCYDTSVDEFCTKDNISYIPFKGSKSLIYITVLKRYVRHQLWYDYYFHDENNFKYFIPISKENTCRSLVDNILKKHTLVVSGVFKVVRNDYDFYVPNNDKYILDIE
jgi:hypothetical protein